MSEVWEDLGNAKPEKKGDGCARIPIKPRVALIHESDEVRQTRATANLAAIHTLDPHCTPDSEGFISMKFQDKQFDFWLTTGCWFIHSTQTYGTGIPKICDQIKRKLLKADQA